MQPARAPFRPRRAVPAPTAVIVAALVLPLALAAAPARAQSAENVLVVANDASPASLRIADYYARARGIAGDAILRLHLEPKDEISRANFDLLIQQPIAEWLWKQNAQDRILFIVLTKGVPLRITGTAGRTGTQASVDSELALLYRRMAGEGAPIEGAVPNPYFLGSAPVGEAKRFTHRDQDIFLVTRLDGFTMEDALALVDRAAKPEPRGRILLDAKAAWSDQGNEWLKQAATWLQANGFAGRVAFEETSRVLADEADVIGYYSWGSNDPAIKQRHFGLKFLPGAIAGMFVSTDARTFAEPPATWNLGSWNDPKTFFAGSPQSLAGDMIRDGVTGVAGHVAEPYLDGTIRPNVLFPAYVSGFNLAEAFYLAMPSLSWQTVVVGDPLCAPFPGKALTRADIDAGVDAATGLPARFARKAMRVAAAHAKTADGATLIVKANAASARGDKAGARAALEQLAALEPRLVGPRVQLAMMYEEAGDYDKAIAHYRALLEVDPRHVVALNNLAYTLAVRKGRPGDALPLAERAYTLAGANASILDTLGWVYHLAGDDKKAAPLILQASTLDASNAEIHLHLAIVYAAGGMTEAAAKSLDRAVALDASIAKREEAIALRAKLPGGKKEKAT